MSRPTHGDLLIEDDIPEHTASSEAAVLQAGLVKRRLAPAEQIARRMLWAACPPALRIDLKRKRSLVIVIEAPASWLDLLQEAARDVIRPADVTVSELKPGAKTCSLQDLGLRSALALRRSFVILTTQGVSGISRAVLAAADYHLCVAAPDRSILAAALKAVYGLRRRPRLPADIRITAEASAIAAAIRPGESAAHAIRRLIALQTGSRTAPIVDLPPGPNLSELHGYGLAKEWGLELARDLEAFRAGAIPWGALSSAAILHGAPGVGKTYFAAALARTCNTPLTTTSLGRLFASSSGHLDSIVKGFDRAFEEARTKGPSILFIDELDALPDRKTLTGRGRDWWSPVCNHVLKLLDDSRERVIVLAATNMIDRIDDALLRPGRIDRHFEIGLPDLEALVAMLRQHLQNDLPEADLRPIGQLVQGYTGARVELLVRSARAAARQAMRPLEIQDLISLIVPGTKDRAELRRICIHEAGHALVAHLVSRRVQYVTTLGDDRRGGCVEMEPLTTAISRRQIEDQVLINLAGRNAEILLLGESSSGVHTDLKVATQLLCAVHGSFGLGESLIQLASAFEPGALTAHPRLQDRVEADLQRLDARCATLLRDHRAQLQVIADELATRRVIQGRDLATLVRP